MADLTEVDWYNLTARRGCSCGCEKLIKALERIANNETRADRRKKGMVDVSELEALRRIARTILNEMKRSK